MYCKNCGAENPDGAKFCQNCGASLSSENENEKSGETNYDLEMLNFNAEGKQNENYEEKKQEMPGYRHAVISLVLGIIGIVCLCIPVVGLILGIVGMALASVAKGKGYDSGIRTGGFICSLISLIIGVVVLIIYIIFGAALIGSALPFAIDEVVEEAEDTDKEEAEEEEVLTEETMEDIEVLIMSDDNLDVYYTGCTTEGLNFSVTNYTDSEVYLAFNSLALDYVSYDIQSTDCYNSIVVSPESTGTGTQVMPEEFSMDFCLLAGSLGYDVGEDDREDNYYYFEDIVVSDDFDEISMEAEGSYVYGDDNIEIYVEGCDSEGVHFMICNHTESESWVAFSSLSLDGVSYDIENSDYYNGFNIAPGGYGEIVQELPGDFSTEVYEISGAARYSIGNEGEDVDLDFSDVYVE